MKRREAPPIFVFSIVLHRKPSKNARSATDFSYFLGVLNENHMKKKKNEKSHRFSYFQLVFNEPPIKQHGVPLFFLSSNVFQRRSDETPRNATDFTYI